MAFFCRFGCCLRVSQLNLGHSVISYSTTLAQLVLKHNFPKTAEVTAVVDVRLILEKLDAEKTAVGQWVNIIGYIAASPASLASESRKLERDFSSVHVQALMLWSAGPLNIDRYELCLVELGAANGP